MTPDERKEFIEEIAEAMRAARKVWETSDWPAKLARYHRDAPGRMPAQVGAMRAYAATRPGGDGDRGAGGCAIAFLTSPTSGNTLAVTVGGGGNAGTTGSGYSGGTAGGAGVVIVEW